MKLGLEGKRAIVLGASKGLGAAIALALANEGAHVIGGARSTEAIEALGSKLEPDAQGTISALSLNLADPQSISAFIEKVQSDNGADIVINNSGGPPPGDAATIPAADFARHFAVMVQPLIAISQAVLPGMQQRRWGRIITLTSSGVVSPLPRLALSNALRQSLLGWSKTLAGEVAADNIRPTSSFRVASTPTASMNWTPPTPSGPARALKRCALPRLQQSLPGVTARQRNWQT